MKEEKLIELLDENEVDVEMDTKVSKKIRLTVYKKIFLSLMSVILVVFLFFAMDYYIDLFSGKIYQPFKEDETINGPLDPEGAGFTILMTDYFNLHYPGYAYFGEYTSIEKKNYNTYEFRGNLFYASAPMMIGGNNNIHGTIHKNKLSIDMTETYALTNTLHEYDDEGDWDDEDMMAEIRLLPESCRIDVGIAFKDIDTLEETVDFMQAYPNSDFFWIATSNTDTMLHGIHAGIPLYDMARYEMSDEFHERYPEYYLTSEDDADKILTMYLSKLRLLKDHSSFTSLISSWRGDAYIYNSYTKYINDLYENVSENGVTPIGIRATVTKADLLKMYEAKVFAKLTIHDVKLSEYDFY